MRFAEALRALPRPVYLRPLKVALVVGTALNLINLPEAILGLEHLVIWKLAMTFCVPFCVSTYGAACAVMETGSGA